MAAEPAVTPGSAEPALDRLADGAGAIVIGADYRGLGVVRSLGRRGIPVVVLKDPDDVLAAYSRFSSRSLWWPEGDRVRVAALQTLADDGAAGWALIPTTDEAAALLSRNHDVLSRRLVVTVPNWDVLRWTYDKRLTHQLAESVGVDYPTTFYPESEAELAALGVEFPVILKPTAASTLNRFTSAKAWRVDDRNSLIRRYREACSLVDPRTVTVQQLLPGSGEVRFSFAALALEGRPLASLVARRTRQYPADFGKASTFVETVDEPDVRAESLKLIERIRFTGLIEVELQRDPRDGRLKLLDMNPRVWGWHTLCARAGLDFPHLLWRMHRGETIEEITPRIGVAWRRLSTDLPTSLREIAAGRMSARDYARSLRIPHESAIFARDDPLPALIEAPVVARMVLRRRLRGRGSDAVAL